MIPTSRKRKMPKSTATVKEHIAFIYQWLKELDERIERLEDLLDEHTNEEIVINPEVKT